MTDRELMQMALDALESDCDATKFGASEALRARLAQPEPEPVAWADKYDIEREGHDFYANRQQPAKDGVSLYTAQPQREWVGLTLDEIFDSTHGFTRIQKDDWVATDTDIAEFAHIIEARLKAKNT